jgi:hypothetical protein
MSYQDLSSFDKWGRGLIQFAINHGFNVKVTNRGGVLTHPDVQGTDHYVMVPHKAGDRRATLNAERGVDRIINQIPKDRKTMGTPTPSKPRQIQERCPFCGPLKDGQTISQHNSLHLNADQIEAIDTLTALRELLGVDKADSQRLADLEQENIDLRQKLQATELELNEIRTWKNNLKGMLQS